MCGQMFVAGDTIRKQTIILRSNTSTFSRYYSILAIYMMWSVCAVFFGVSMIFALLTPLQSFPLDLEEDQMENTTLVEV